MNWLKANVRCNVPWFSPFLLAVCNGSTNMSIGTILLVILILMLVGLLPTWPHSQA